MITIDLNPRITFLEFGFVKQTVRGGEGGGRRWEQKRLSRDARSPPSLSAVSRHDDAKRQKQESPGASVNVKSWICIVVGEVRFCGWMAERGRALSWSGPWGEGILVPSLRVYLCYRSRPQKRPMSPMMYPIYEDFNCSRSKNYSLFRVNFASKSCWFSFSFSFGIFKVKISS